MRKTHLLFIFLLAGTAHGFAPASAWGATESRFSWEVSRFKQIATEQGFALIERLYYFLTHEGRETRGITGVIGKKYGICRTEAFKILRSASRGTPMLAHDRSFPAVEVPYGRAFLIFPESMLYAPTLNGPRTVTCRDEEGKNFQVETMPLALTSLRFDRGPSGPLRMKVVVGKAYIYGNPFSVALMTEAGPIRLRSDGPGRVSIDSYYQEGQIMLDGKFRLEFLKNIDEPSPGATRIIIGDKSELSMEGEAMPLHGGDLVELYPSGVNISRASPK